MMKTAQQIINKTPSANVYDRLLDYVFSDQVSPGEKLVERELAEKFKVSRVPIRESLAKMVAQGLLIGGERRQGVRKRRYTPAESRQLLEFRSFLECCAIEVAAQRAESNDIETLESICDKAEAIDVINDWETWANLDHQFHAGIARASHNERVATSLEGLLTECHFIFYVHPSSKWSDSEEKTMAMKNRVVDEHRRIVAAIVAGDGAAGTEILNRHLFV